MKIRETLITKYKPFYINDFYLKDELQCVFKTLFEIDDLNILLIGSTNSGKTSLLYAIIREYYDLKKTDSIPENNIMFINNLKEQGINYYRTEMKTFCQSHSSIFGKKKMVVIDDMDTINEQSQQVFRNYIDKYKNNVHFISVCTNIQKIIESIQSRLNILKINSLSETNIRIIMDKIIQNENISIDEEAKEYLLGISENSIRNIINNLEKIYIYGEHMDIESCKKLCSSIYSKHFEEYIQFIVNIEETKDIINPIQKLYSIHDYGYSVIDILDNFYSFIKVTNILNETQKYKIIPVICKYITIFHNTHEDPIELSLFTNDLCKVLFE